MKRSNAYVIKLLRTVLYILTALIVSDVMLKGWMERYYSEPPAILSNFSSMYGLNGFWKLLDENQKPIVFTGSSMLFAAVSPHVFDKHILERTGKSVVSVNVGTTGQVSYQARDMIRDLFIPEASTVFYMTEMRAYATRPGIAEYLSSPLGSTMQMETGLRKSLGLWLFRHSGYVRYRQNLFDLLTGKRTVQSGFENYGFIDDRGFTPWYGAKDQSKKADVPNDFTPFVVEDIYRQALVEIIDVCQRTNSRCVIVQLPVDRTLFKVMTIQDHQQFNELVATTIGSTDVEYWNFNTETCLTALGENSFSDFDHMNRKGTDVFTAMLADLYVYRFMDVPLASDTPANCVKLS